VARILSAIERLQGEAPAEPSPGCVNRQANNETKAHTQHDSLKHMSTISNCRWKTMFNTGTTEEVVKNSQAEI
jgi:hypothetical protein